MLFLILSDYRSEDDSQLELRRDRGRVTTPPLTPRSVRHVYDSVRVPPDPLEDFDPSTIYQILEEGTVSRGTSVGVGESAPLPKTTLATGVGVGASMRVTATTTSARPVLSTGVGSASVVRSTSTGKQPRASPHASRRLASRRRRRAREAAVLRRARMSLAGAGGDGGGGDDDDDDGSDSGRGRRMRDNLDDLMDRERRRANGRRIAGITHTSTITTTYKDGGPP